MRPGVRIRLLDVNAETVLPRREMRFQRQLRDQIVTGVLPPKADWLGVPQIIQPLPELLAQGGKACFIGFAGAVGDERRQHLEPWVVQHAVLDREQDIVDRPVDAARGVMRLPAAGGETVLGIDS